MAWGDESPIIPAREETGQMTFVVEEDKANQYRAFKEEHNKTCPYPEWLAAFTPTNKYHFTVRDTGLGLDFKLHCSCGVSFYADAGDEFL